LPKKHDIKTGARYSENTYLVVHTEMLLHVCRDYHGIGDYRNLTASEIRFFYDGLRGELKEATKPKG
jgi:hypothetical protein